MKTNISLLIEQMGLPGCEKFRVSKRLIAMSEKNPAALVPCFTQFRGLMNAENQIIKWTAFKIIANLSTVADGRQIAAVIDEYLAPISGPVMITAANAIVGAAKIAAAQPVLAEKVVRGILCVEHARYQTDECRNIAIGRAITALGTIGKEIAGQPSVVNFVERQTSNSRNATRKKAVAFLRKLATRQ